MPRLLATWLQIHPNIKRVQAGAALAVDSLNHSTGRRWEPDVDIKLADLDAELAKSPPNSTAKLMEIVAGLISRETGQPCSVVEPPPPPEPQPEPEPRLLTKTPAESEG